MTALNALWFGAGLVLGSSFGVVIMVILVMGKRGDAL